MVCKQTCSCGNEVDKSMWETFGAFDLVHSSYKWIPTILFFGKHSTTILIWIVSRLWFCWRPWGLEINLRWSLVHFRKSHVCANKLDVQETDFSFTQFYRSWNHFSRCRFTQDGTPALDLWDLVIDVFHSSPKQTNETKDVREPRGNLSATQSNMRKQIPTTNTNPDLINIDHVPSSGTHSGSNAMSLRIMKPRLRW